MMPGLGKALQLFHMVQSDIILPAMEISKKIYIRGDKAIERLKNLQKIADEKYLGNFSLMVNDTLNKIFNLDPVTGKQKGDPQ